MGKCFVGFSRKPIFLHISCLLLFLIPLVGTSCGSLFSCVLLFLLWFSSSQVFFCSLSGSMLSCFLLFLVWFIYLYFLLTSITHQKSCFHRFCEPEFSSIQDKTYLCPKFGLCTHISSKKKELLPTFYQK